MSERNAGARPLASCNNIYDLTLVVLMEISGDATRIIAGFVNAHERP